MHIASYKYSNNVDNGITILFLLLFLLCPFALLLVALYYLLKKDPSYWHVILIASLFSLINITIDWENTDYRWYIPQYKDALKVNFISYIWSLNGAKEPIYTSLTYFLSHIFGGNGIAFSLFSTIFFYYFMIESLVVIRKSMKLKRKYLLLGVCILLFFPYIFANSANHVRQYWGIALVSFSLSKVLFEGKKYYWILAILSMFIHTSSGLIVFLSAIPFLKYKISIRNSFYYALSFIILFSISSVAAVLLPFFGDTILNQALYKAAYGTTFETEFSLIKVLFACIFVGIPLLVVNNSYFKKKEAVMTLVNIQVMLLVFIVANLKHPEFCVRMNEYIWCYIPSIIMIAASQLDIGRSSIFLIIAILLFFFIFYQAVLTQNTYYCENDYLWQNLYSFFEQSKIK